MQFRTRIKTNILTLFGELLLYIFLPITNGMVGGVAALPASPRFYPTEVPPTLTFDGSPLPSITRDQGPVKISLSSEYGTSAASSWSFASSQPIEDLKIQEEEEEEEEEMSRTSTESEWLILKPTFLYKRGTVLPLLNLTGDIATSEPAAEALNERDLEHRGILLDRPVSSAVESSSSSSSAATTTTSATAVTPLYKPEDSLMIESNNSSTVFLKTERAITDSAVAIAAAPALADIPTTSKTEEETFIISSSNNNNNSKTSLESSSTTFELKNLKKIVVNQSEHSFTNSPSVPEIDSNKTNLSAMTTTAKTIQYNNISNNNNNNSVSRNPKSFSPSSSSSSSNLPDKIFPVISLSNSSNNNNNKEVVMNSLVENPTVGVSDSPPPPSDFVDENTLLPEHRDVPSTTYYPEVPVVNNALSTSTVWAVISTSTLINGGSVEDIPVTEKVIRGAENNPSADSRVGEEILPPGAIAGVVVAVVGFAVVVAALLGFVIYRRLPFMKSNPFSNKVPSDNCNYLDDSLQVSYINYHIEMPKEPCDEMFSLDNDSFLNSLEAMTMENYWADNSKNTKL